MPIPESQAWREAEASTPRDDVLLATIELQHSVFLDGNGAPSPIRIVRNTEDVSLRLESTAAYNAGEVVLFKAIPFEIEFPRIGQLGVECPIKIDNVGREVAKYLTAATALNENVICIFRGYLASDPNTVGRGPHRLSLRNVKRRSTSLSGALIAGIPRNKTVLSDVYDMTRFKSLISFS